MLLLKYNYFVLSMSCDEEWMDVLLLDYKDNKFYLFFLFGIIMSIPKNMYELSIEKMQQSINRLET